MSERQTNLRAKLMWIAENWDYHAQANANGSISVTAAAAAFELKRLEGLVDAQAELIMSLEAMIEDLKVEKEAIK